MHAKRLPHVALLAVVCAVTIGRLPALTVSANFDGLSPNASVPSSYTEGGIQFTSPTSFNVASGSFGAVLFGWGGYVFNGNALYVHNDGWVGISVPGSELDRVTFTYGFDWNGYTIENGLMDTTFDWRALAGDNLVASGSQSWGRDNRTHGNILLSVDPAVPFDTLLVRSTAVEYQGVARVGAQSTGGWFFDRGSVIGHGDANHIALDNVAVTTLAATTAVPELPSTLALFATAASALAILARRITRRSR